MTDNSVRMTDKTYYNYSFDSDIAIVLFRGRSLHRHGQGEVAREIRAGESYRGLLFYRLLPSSLTHCHPGSVKREGARLGVLVVVVA